MKTTLSRRTSLLWISMIKMLERFSYYGIRAVIVLYAIDETNGLNLTSEDALSYYGTLTLLISVLALPIGVLTDGVFKQKQGALIGLITTFLGCGLLIADSVESAILGCLLIVIGSNFTSVSLPILVGRHFIKTDNKRDLAFILFFLFINLGAFFGAVGLGAVGSAWSYQYSFALATAALLIATILYYFIKDKLPLLVLHPNENVSIDTEILDMEMTAPASHSPTVPRTSIYPILLTIFVTGLFWLAFEVYNNVFFLRGSEIDNLMLWGFPLPSSMLYSFSSFFSIIALQIFFVIWWIRGSGSSILKIGMACVLMSISLFILYFTSGVAADNFLKAAILPMILLAVAETFISPIAISYITRLSDLRYASTIYGGYIFGLYILSKGSIILDYFDDNQAVMGAGILTLLIGVGFLLLKKQLLRWSGGIG